MYSFCLEELHLRPVIIRPASICTLSNKSVSFFVQLPHTSPYSKTVQMSYFYLCLCVCQYLWIIKFLEWAYRKKWGIWGGIFIDWDIEGSLFVWFRRIQKRKSTKTDKTDKKLNHLSFQSTEQLINNTFLTWYMGIKRDKSGKSSSQIILTEELLGKKMLAKSKHKKLWKFYWNPFCCLGRVMDNATVSSLYCIAL
jgi:hypothetical protein